MRITKATITAYASATHTASVRTAGSLPYNLDSIRVATNIPASAIIAGRECSVLHLDEHNPTDALVLSIQGAMPPPFGDHPYFMIYDTDYDTFVNTETTADCDTIRMGVASVDRLLLQGVSPHVTLTGDLDVSGHAAFGAGATPVASYAVDVIDTLAVHPSAALHASIAGNRAAGPQFTYGIHGGASGQGTPSAAYVYGLNFFAQHATPSPCWQLGGILIQQQSAVAGSGALTIARGFYLPVAYWGGALPVTVCGIDIEEQGGAGAGTAYGLRIANQTATTVRLLELGPATPYLRLVGGAAPAANQTHLWLAEGVTPTLRRVEWKDAAAVVAGDRVMLLV